MKVLFEAYHVQDGERGVEIAMRGLKNNDPDSPIFGEEDSACLGLVLRFDLLDNKNLSIEQGQHYVVTIEKATAPKTQVTAAPKKGSAKATKKKS